MKSSAEKSRIVLGAVSGAGSTHLDALRALAAFGVLASHWRDCLFVDYPDVHAHRKLLSLVYVFTGVGHQWVVVFFVLSGYLVGGSVLRLMGAEQWSWKGYAIKRLTRLYTVLIPALILGGSIDLFGIHLFGAGGIYGGHSGTHEIAGSVASRLSLSVMAGNYASLQDIYVPVLGTNGPLWSLSYEFWYYLIFPLLMCALWYERRVAPRIGSAILSVIALGILGRDGALLSLIWMMGLIIHWLPKKKSSTALGRGLCMSGSLAAATLTIAACKSVHYHPQGLRHFVPSDLALGAVVTFLVYALANFSEKRMSGVYTRLVQHAARSSYTLYLVHVPALVFLAAWTGHSRWQPDATHLPMALAILVAVSVYAQTIYYCFERNTDTLRRWLEAHLLTARPGANRHIEPAVPAPIL